MSRTLLLSCNTARCMITSLILWMYTPNYRLVSPSNDAYSWHDPLYLAPTATLTPISSSRVTVNHQTKKWWSHHNSTISAGSVYSEVSAVDFAYYAYFTLFGGQIDYYPPVDVHAARPYVNIVMTTWYEVLLSASTVKIEGSMTAVGTKVCTISEPHPKTCDTSFLDT